MTEPTGPTTQALIDRWRTEAKRQEDEARTDPPNGPQARRRVIAEILRRCASELERAAADALRSLPPDDGSIRLSAEDARGLAFLLGRAIRDDREASDADRREARKLLVKLGGDTQ